ncbi:unnamed protein product [Durusdinium trenchii]|uniref:cGMP-dependent protein kinase n=2 Tax=Durusdinium trenchii TaxID=1381693 RepID=A0ABP0L4B0_9DINO
MPTPVLEGTAIAASFAAIGSTLTTAIQPRARNQREPLCDISGTLEVLQQVREAATDACGAGIQKLVGLVKRKNAEMSEEEFQQLLTFLGAVPLFQKQLPRAELPRVAAALKSVSFEPGERVIEAGREGQSFFIIKAGEASVIREDETGAEFECATLYNYDYFGGRTLIEKRPNVATIVAKGAQPLELLTLSREDFQKLGFHEKLKFARRPAIYEGRRMEDIMVEPRRKLIVMDEENEDLPLAGLASSELEFIVKAVKNNPNLRGAYGKDEETIRSMAAQARRIQVPPEKEIAQAGNLGHEFFIISQGSFDLFSNVRRGKAGVRSAEAVFTSSSMTERLVRKQQFLLDMLKERKKDGPVQTVRNSMLPATNQKRPDRQKWTANSSMGVTKKGSMPARKQRRGSEANSSGGTPSTSFRAFFPRTISVEPPDQEDDESSPFQPGDKVAALVAGWDVQKEMGVGKVIEVVVPGPQGTVTVEFPDGTREAKVQLLRPVEDATPLCRLVSGECYGELSLLYNTRHLATCKAVEPSVVYVVPYRAFKQCFGNRERAQEKAWIKLLDEVHFLNALVRSERAEVARNAVGQMSFKPGEKVMTQGEMTEQLWFVVEKGSCHVTRKDSAGHIELSAELRRGNHFGERSIFLQQRTAEVTVEAGAKGMTCLVLDGELLRNLPLGVTGEETDFGVPGTEQSLVEYHRKSSAAVRPQREEIPFDELERTHVLGEGGFGAVYLCHRKNKPGIEYALKRLSKGYIVQANAEKQVCAERDILSMMDCDCITRFYGSYQDTEYVYMLIELVPGGHLYQLLCDKPQVLLSDKPRGYAAMFYSSCVILAFEYLHERRIAYRDLKLENVLLDSTGYAKLCDMGFARFVLSKTHTLLGTPEYMAPEMIDPPHGHNHMVDWWALGVLVFEMLSGQAPWDNMGYDDNPMGQLLALRESQNQGLPDGFLPPSLILARDFIKKLVVVKPERRLGAHGVEEVKNSGWFKSGTFSWERLVARQMSPPYQPPAATYSEEPVPKPAQASRESMSEGRNKLFVKSSAQDDWAADF